MHRNGPLPQVWSMNFPPAPLSMRAKVSTVLFFSQFTMIGIDRAFDFIVATVVENTSNIGEIDVDAILLIKNPLFPLHHRISLSLRRPFGLSSSVCERIVPWHSSSLGQKRWKGLACKLWSSSFSLGNLG